MYALRKLLEIAVSQIRQIMPIRTNAAAELVNIFLKPVAYSFRSLHMKFSFRSSTVFIIVYFLLSPGWLDSFFISFSICNRTEFSGSVIKSKPIIEAPIPNPPQILYVFRHPTNWIKFKVKIYIRRTYWRMLFRCYLSSKSK